MENLNDSKIIKFFESEIARRKSSPNADLFLSNLKDIFQAMMPYLNMSEPAKNYIKTKIDDSIKAISK
jgi:hypothetical protein